MNAHAREEGTVPGGVRARATLAWLLPVCLLWTLGDVIAQETESMDLPNIVIIMPDDLGRYDVSMHGGDIATPQHRQHRPRRRAAVALLFGARLLADPHRPHDRPLPDPRRPHALGRGAVAGLRTRHERSPDARGARACRLRTPRHLRQVAPRPLPAQVAPAAARLHGVRGARFRRRLLHPRAPRRAGLEPRLRTTRRGGIRHGPAGRPGRQLHRRPRRRRGAVLPLRALRGAAHAHPGQGRGPAPLRPSSRPSSRPAAGRRPPATTP